MTNFRYADTLTGAVTQVTEDSIRVRDSHHDVRVGVSSRGEIQGYPYPPDGEKRPHIRLVRLPDAVVSDTSLARWTALSCGAPRRQ